MPRLVFFFWFFAICLSTQAQAEIYKWRDENGVLHFEDRAPAEILSGSGVETKSDSVDPGSTFTQAVSKPVATGVANQITDYGNVKVEVYLTSWCPYCKKTLEFFQSRGVSVRAYDIEKDSAAARRKERLDPRNGIPTTVVNGRVIHGYAPEALEAALKQTH